MNRISKHLLSATQIIFYTVALHSSFGHLHTRIHTHAYILHLTRFHAFGLAWTSANKWHVTWKVIKQRKPEINHQTPAYKRKKKKRTKPRTRAYTHSQTWVLALRCATHTLIHYSRAPCHSSCLNAKRHTSRLFFFFFLAFGWQH